MPIDLALSFLNHLRPIHSLRDQKTEAQTDSQVKRKYPAEAKVCVQVPGSEFYALSFSLDLTLKALSSVWNPRAFI